MAEIELKNLTKRWGNFVGVDNFNLTISDQEFLVLLGPSGCGKTTTMRMIAGLEGVTNGQVLIDGKVVNDLEPKDRDVAMVFQSYALYPNMTVYENICFPLKVRKIDKALHKEKVMRASEMVELNDFLHRKPAELSGGMQKRVAIARAVVMKPKYLFCDEPNSGLDPKTAIVIDNLIREITQENNITTVINSHDMNSVMEIGDTILFLKDGVKAWEGSKELIFNTDNEAVNDFVYSSNLMKKIKQMQV